MEKKLAIKGHLSRGKEVIELFKMMGGCECGYGGGGTGFYYYISQFGNIEASCKPTEFDTYIVYTLEEFLEKYPYKLNELVLCDDGLLGTITKMEWDCEKSDMKYHISFDIPVYNKWCSSKNIKCKFMEAKSKKLAILGHKTRSHEVIELLKIMGGKICAFDYDSDGYAYYIDTSTNMIICSNENKIKHNLDKYQLFTLEEFWEKYPFKIGDKVIDTADGCPGIVSEMKWDEGLSDMKYFVTFGNGVDFGWYLNDSIEFCEENKNLDETHQKRDIDKSDFIIKHMILPNKMDDKLEYKIIDGYEFDKVENNKIILKPIKSEYPKTYKECCDVLLIPPFYNLRYHTYEHGYNEYATSNSLLSLQDKLNTLGKLIICYNAYRKIAGEQMGLDKPWEPAIQDTIWGITRSKDEVEKYSCHYGKTKLLEFPNEEIRDAFYENFKDLIEQCKELL